MDVVNDEIAQYRIDWRKVGGLNLCLGRNHSSLLLRKLLLLSGIFRSLARRIICSLRAAPSVLGLLMLSCFRS